FLELKNELPFQTRVAERAGMDPMISIQRRRRVAFLKQAGRDTIGRWRKFHCLQKQRRLSGGCHERMRSEEHTLNSSHVKISYATVIYTLSLHDALPIFP